MKIAKIKKQTFAAVIVLLCGTACSTPPAKTQETPPSPSLVALHDVDPTIIQEMRYATNHNFIGRPIKGYDAPHCLLTKEAAHALSQVQAELKTQSMSLKVYDCYRPQRAVDDFVAWASDLTALKMKKEFYPKVEKTTLFKDGYIAKKSGHSRGSTMDLTIVSLPAEPEASFKEGQKLEECFLPEGRRFDDNSLDMGTGYDCFDLLSHTDNPAISSAQKQNRLLLKSLMEKYGFKNLYTEWWHYTLKDEPYPTQYFDFEIK